MMGDFKNDLISRIFSVFYSSFFTPNYAKSLVKLILTCFLEF